MCNLCENIEEKKLPKEGGRERAREEEGKRNDRAKSLKTKYLNIKFYYVYMSAVLRNRAEEVCRRWSRECQRMKIINKIREAAK